MEAFLEQLQILRFQFDVLSSDDQEDALAAVAETVGAMRDASVRRRFEKEIELTLAWEAEKMIVERFAGDWSSVNSFNEPSTSSFGFGTSPTFSENNLERNDRNDPDFSCDQFEGIHLENARSQSTVSSEKSQSKSLSISAVESANRLRRSSEENDARSHNIDGQPLHTIGETNCIPSKMFRTGSEIGKENRHVCATCGFSANNRKALYRHGVKTKHVLRQPNSSGSLVCALCPFRTNKMFNYNRHLKRFHKEALQCSPSAA